MLSKKDSERIVRYIVEKWPGPPEIKAKNIRTVELDEDSGLLIVGDGLTAVKQGEVILPFLQSEGRLEAFSKVVVDVGAIRYVCNGADVMRPGIRGFEGEFKSGGVVAVKEEGHGKFIAVGLAVVDSSEATSMGRGAVVKNLHYVGDKFWEAYKSIG